MPRRPIHVFPLAGLFSAAFCGRSEVGDGWTAVRARVTCTACRQRIEAELRERLASQRSVGNEPPIAR